MNMKLVIGCLLTAAPLLAMENKKVNVWVKADGLDSGIASEAANHGFGKYYTEYSKNPVIQMCQELDRTKDLGRSPFWGDQAVAQIQEMDAKLEKLPVIRSKLLETLVATQGLSAMRYSDGSKESEETWQTFRDLYWNNAKDLATLKLANLNNPEQFLQDNSQIDSLTAMPEFYAVLYLYHHVKARYSQNPGHLLFFQFDQASKEDQVQESLINIFQQASEEDQNNENSSSTCSASSSSSNNCNNDNNDNVLIPSVIEEEEENIEEIGDSSSSRCNLF